MILLFMQDLHPLALKLQRANNSYYRIPQMPDQCRHVPFIFMTSTTNFSPSVSTLGQEETGRKRKTYKES
ncbi:MAG: hypothetical protein MJE68_28945 [Proteobacteria bacterium]|nr:hypothetical protein [Pseudomonadota bacterium]